ncbi:hypothetical protein CCR85_09360 [Rhodothalassium salexigens]|uniref:glycerophosphodiester phosphodiesterase family protein n=1 Tax=Rhodothalassium salexigens TaxID=1086 RepID=UPI0019134277|nr:glycerophosphodiester phosphodiesterase family protein [Rhodothalassium salexigens]MBK5911693.1 hypothetical protein [Rhodothalassium salexigens]
MPEHTAADPAARPLSGSFSLSRLAARLIPKALIPALAPALSPALPRALVAIAAVLAAPVAGHGQEPAPAASAPAIAYLRCLDAADVALVSAHRGGPAPGYPENALETFAHAASLGPVALEVDVRRSADGVLLLMHDDTLDRTTTGAGPVADTPWQRIAGLRLRDNDGAATDFAVPTLDAALDWALDWRGAPVLLQLDVKRGVDIARVARAVRARGAEAVAMVITYSADAAATALAANDRLGVSVSVDTAADLKTLAARGVDPRRILAWTGVGAPAPALWQALDAAGVPVSFGTMWDIDRAIAASGDDARYRRLVGQGVDLLATDRAAAAHAAITDRAAAARAARRCAVPSR